MKEEIDSTIQPLVNLLNNQYTTTQYSCGGHWEWGVATFQYPYVSFKVVGDLEEWTTISDEACFAGLWNSEKWKRLTRF